MSYRGVGRAWGWGSEGGAAFGSGSPEHGGHTGMSLRDYFATVALQGLLSGTTDKRAWEGFNSRAFRQGHTTCAPIFAHDAYEIADAMLAERQKRND